MTAASPLAASNDTTIGCEGHDMDMHSLVTAMAGDGRASAWDEDALVCDIIFVRCDGCPCRPPVDLL